LSRDRETGALHVREAPPGLAGEEAGLVPGDRVKMIDGVLADGLDKDRIQGLLRGPVGTAVTLTVIRGDEVIHVEVDRQPFGKEPTLPDRHETIE
jgi:C-terminal processing protease CtpA/Prc